MSSEIGVPVVSSSPLSSSSKTPERMRTVSGSRRWVVKRDWPGPALVHPVLDLGLGDRDARRAAVDDAADRRPVALAPGGHAKEMAEGVVRHWPPGSESLGSRQAVMRRQTARQRSAEQVGSPSARCAVLATLDRPPSGSVRLGALFHLYLDYGKNHRRCHNQRENTRLWRHCVLPTFKLCKIVLLGRGAISFGRAGGRRRFGLGRDGVVQTSHKGS